MKTRPADKETLNAAIRKAIEANGGKRISRPDFLAASGMKPRDIFHSYAKWQDALIGAGYKFKPYHRPPAPSDLLAEWGAVVRKLRRIPTQIEYNLHGPRSSSALGLQFGSWFHVPGAFRRFARKRKEWAGVLALIDTLPQRTTKWKTKSPATPRPRLIRKSRLSEAAPRPARRMRERPEFGDLLDIPALRHAPSNEQGVIYLFGILAERLGFAVERLQMAFPDCLAKRRISRTGIWQPVAIEFEYESRNFRDHRHDPKGCDLIICWTHNWPDCPKNLEVIALSEQLKAFAFSKTNAGDR